MLQILVILPTYNERGNIGSLLDLLFKLTPQVDVLVIDDNSPDGTADCVREKQKQYGPERLQLIVRSEGKAGRGSACMMGFRIARDQGYSAAIEMDADLSHDPSDIPRLLSSLSTNDVVIGSKQVRGSSTVGCRWHRVLFSRIANVYAGLVLRLPVKDYTSGYRCFGTRALALLPDLKIDGRGFTVIPQVTYQLHKAGMSIAEIPITFVNRRHGKSNVSKQEILESFLGILRIRSPLLYQHVRQLTKFAITGFTNLFLDLLLLAACIELLDLPLIIASPLTGSIVITNVFLMHKFWTFDNREKRLKSQGMKFAFVYGASFVLLNVLTWFFAELMGIWYIFSRIGAVFICAIWNYLWMHFGVFTRQASSNLTAPSSSQVHGN